MRGDVGGHLQLSHAKTLVNAFSCQASHVICDPAACRDQVCAGCLSLQKVAFHCNVRLLWPLIKPSWLSCVYTRLRAVKAPAECVTNVYPPVTHNY